MIMRINTSLLWYIPLWIIVPINITLWVLVEILKVIGKTLAFATNKTSELGDMIHEKTGRSHKTTDIIEKYKVEKELRRQRKKGE